MRCPIRASRAPAIPPARHALCAAVLVVLAVLGPGCLARALAQRGQDRPATYALPPAASPAPPSEWERNNIDVYDKAGPGVVHISSVTLRWDFSYNIVPSEGTGSGAVIDKLGHILTNLHVIQQAQTVFVTLADKSKYRAAVMGADPTSDLAVLRIQAPAAALSPIPMGTSAGLRIGQKVLAIGNPFGLERTLTTGIISSLGRSLKTEQGRVIENLIQTDAAINPGNSGGPLLDSSGQLIGVNTAIFSPSGGSVGIGFAVPVDRVRRVLPDLITTGSVRHAWLGIRWFPVSSDLAALLKLPVQKGILVVEAVPGGPAAASGIRGASHQVTIGNIVLGVGGDVITSIEGAPVENAAQLFNALGNQRPGDSAHIGVVRADGSATTVTVALGEQPEDY